MSVFIKQIIDDLWIDVFTFCAVVEFVHVGETCKKFAKITNDSNPRINKYWEISCKQLCSSIEPTYQTKKWHDIYWELRNLLYRHGYIEKIDDKTHDIIEPKPPIELRRHLRSLQTVKSNSTCNNDDIPVFLQFCAHDCPNLLDMKFYQLIKFQLINNDSNIDINIDVDINNTQDIINHINGNNLKSDEKLVYQEIVSNVINQSEKSLNDDKYRNNCALYMAARSGATKIVEYLLSTFAPVININNPNLGDRTPLYIAAFYGYIKIVELLLNHEKMTISGINKQDRKGFNSLFVAAQHGHIEIVELLIKHGADVNISNDQSNTPLWIASLRGYSEVVKCLIESNKVIYYNRCGTQTASSLYVAAQNNHWKCVELLLKSGKCDINLDHNGATPLWKAALEGSIQTLKLLVENGANVEQSDNQVCVSRKNIVYR